MKTQKGKFILFDLGDFSGWLSAIHVNRLIRLVQNHHTWSPSYQNFKVNNHFELLKGMEAAHLERGFSEIAQNLTTFPDGTVAVCRPFDNVPAGIKGANSAGLCIENLGNFDIGQDTMTAEQADTIVKINALLCTRFNLVPSTDTIVYHHWYDLNTGVRTDGTGTTKSCPGTNFFGGNTVAAAQSNFIPLVSNALTSTAIPAAPTAAPLYSARVSADVLNVRSQPSASGKLLKKLRNGTVVQVYEEQGDWRRIHPSEQNWVSGKYLEK